MKNSKNEYFADIFRENKTRQFRDFFIHKSSKWQVDTKFHYHKSRRSTENFPKSGRVPKSKSFYAYKVKKKDFSFGVVRPTGRLIGS